MQLVKLHRSYKAARFLGHSPMIDRWDDVTSTRPNIYRYRERERDSAIVAENEIWVNIDFGEFRSCCAFLPCLCVLYVYTHTFARFLACISGQWNGYGVHCFVYGRYIFFFSTFGSSSNEAFTCISNFNAFLFFSLLQVSANCVHVCRLISPDGRTWVYNKTTIHKHHTKVKFISCSYRKVSRQKRRKKKIIAKYIPARFSSSPRI